MKIQITAISWNHPILPLLIHAQGTYLLDGDTVQKVHEIPPNNYIFTISGLEVGPLGEQRRLTYMLLAWQYGRLVPCCLQVVERRLMEMLAPERVVGRSDMD